MSEQYWKEQARVAIDKARCLQSELTSCKAEMKQVSKYCKALTADKIDAETKADTLEAELEDALESLEVERNSAICFEGCFEDVKEELEAVKASRVALLAAAKEAIHDVSMSLRGQMALGKAIQQAEGGE